MIFLLKFIKPVVLFRTLIFLILKVLTPVILPCEVSFKAKISTISLLRSKKLIVLLAILVSLMLEALILMTLSFNIGIKVGDIGAKIKTENSIEFGTNIVIFDIIETKVIVDFRKKFSIKVGNGNFDILGVTVITGL